MSPEQVSGSEQLRDLLCASCASQLPLCFEDWSPLAKVAYPFAAVMRYEGEIRKGILDLKFQGDRVWSWLFALLARYRLAALKYRPAAIVPIPLGKKRLRTRGYNQVEAWGEILAATLQIPLLRDALWRVRESCPQTHMRDRRGREENIRGVFALEEEIDFSLLAPGGILLIDDVSTSGATLRAAASELVKSGREVRILVLARDEYYAETERVHKAP